MALSANVEIPAKGLDFGEISKPVEAGEVVYKGALVKNDADGFIQPCAAAASTQFAGIALEKVDNTSGADAALEVRVATKGLFLLTLAGSPTQANVGDVFYANDDSACQILGGGANRQKVGVLQYFVSANSGWIDITDGVHNPALSGS